MRYTPVFVPAILALLIVAVTLYKPQMSGDAIPASRASTLSCEGKEDCAFLEKLTPILKDAKSIRVFKFPELCRKCQTPNLSTRDFADLPPTITLGPEDTAFFRTKFSDRGSYILGLQKAMPFFADYGFLLMGQSDTKNILLLSTYSKSVRLIEGGPSKVLIANIDPVFSEISTWLARIFKDKQGR